MNRDELARVEATNVMLQGLVVERDATNEKRREQLTNMTVQHGCNCGHPACKRCRDTRDAADVLNQPNAADAAEKSE